MVDALSLFTVFISYLYLDLEIGREVRGTVIRTTGGRETTLGGRAAERGTEILDGILLTTLGCLIIRGLIADKVLVGL
jgi:hypothetical protein